MCLVGYTVWLCVGACECVCAAGLEALAAFWVSGESVNSMTDGSLEKKKQNPPLVTNETALYGVAIFAYPGLLCCTELVKTLCGELFPHTFYSLKFAKSLILFSRDEKCYQNNNDIGR